MREQTEAFEVYDSDRRQLENACGCIFGSGEPVVILEESITNPKLTSARLKSTKTGRFQEIHE